MKEVYMIYETQTNNLRLSSIRLFFDEIEAQKEVDRLNSKCDFSTVDKRGNVKHKWCLSVRKFKIE